MAKSLRGMIAVGPLMLLAAVVVVAVVVEEEQSTAHVVVAVATALMATTRHALIQQAPSTQIKVALASLDNVETCVVPYVPATHVGLVTNMEALVAASPGAMETVSAWDSNENLPFLLERRLRRYAFALLD